MLSKDICYNVFKGGIPKFGHYFIILGKSIVVKCYKIMGHRVKIKYVTNEFGIIKNCPQKKRRSNNKIILFCNNKMLDIAKFVYHFVILGKVIVVKCYKIMVYIIKVKYVTVEISIK